MFGARSPRTVLVALSFAFASVALGVGVGASVASAASPHRAAVIVDTGGGVHRVVITFNEDSISGIEALQRAGASPVIYAMGPGAAVCRLYGVGRDSSPNCLGGQDGDNRYWAYFRAPAGRSGFTYSSMGAGASRVHDGDVEGWKFGTGTAPAFASVASLAPPPPPPTRPPSPPPATSAPAAGSPGASSGAGTVGGSGLAGNPGTTPTIPRTGAATAAGAAGNAARAGAPATASGSGKNAKSSKSAKSSDRTATNADGRTVDTALASSGQGSGGSSAWSLVWFAALIAAIVAAVFIVRRVRRQPV